MADQELWLNSEQQRLWRLYLGVHRRLMSVLDEELRSKSSLNFAEYEVLVHLSEAPDGRLRMSALAEAILVSRSGLTRRVDQMIRGGLLTKELCEEDRRGTYAQITPKGNLLLEEAAPSHVAGVRKYFVEPLRVLDQRRLGVILGQIDLTMEL